MCFYCIKECHKHKSCHVLKRWKIIKIIKLTENDLIQFRYLQVKLCVAYMLRNKVMKSIMVFGQWMLTSHDGRNEYISKSNLKEQMQSWCWRKQIRSYYRI